MRIYIGLGYIQRILGRKNLEITNKSGLTLRKLSHRFHNKISKQQWKISGFTDYNENIQMASKNKKKSRNNEQIWSHTKKAFSIPLS